MYYVWSGNAIIMASAINKAILVKQYQIHVKMGMHLSTFSLSY